MNCGIDLGCWFAPVTDSWQAAVAFVTTWWWVATHAAAMVLGAFLGPRLTVALITVGSGLLVYDRVRGRHFDTNPDLPVEDQVPPVKKKRRGL